MQGRFLETREMSLQFLLKAKALQHVFMQERLFNFSAV